MTTHTLSLTATDGHQLHGKSWLPDSSPKAVLVMIHGFYEHLGRYEHVATHFVNAGWVVYAIDQRGHGKTKGKRGHANFMQLFDDVETLLMQVRSDYTSLPIVLFGHSWGGCVVSNFLLRKPTGELTAAILSSAWLRLKLIPPKGKEVLGKMMAKLWPSLTISNKLGEGSLSRDPKVEQAYLEDPLVHDKISAGIFQAITDAGPWVIGQANELKVPTLIMHGTADRLTKHAASQQFAQTAGDQVTFKSWDGLFHEMHNEPEKEAVMDTMVNWMLGQLNAV